MTVAALIDAGLNKTAAQAKPPSSGNAPGREPDNHLKVLPIQDTKVSKSADGISHLKRRFAASGNSSQSLSSSSASKRPKSNGCLPGTVVGEAALSDI